MPVAIFTPAPNVAPEPTLAPPTTTNLSKEADPPKKCPEKVPVAPFGANTSEAVVFPRG